MSLQIPLSAPLLPAGHAAFYQQDHSNKQPARNEAVGEKMQGALERSSEQMDKVAKRALTFNIHEDLDRVYVQVIDQETQEVLREVPPEKILDLIASMMKSAGLIIDRHV